MTEPIVTPVQEEDEPNVGKVVAIAIGTLIVFAVGIVYVLLVLHFTHTSPKRLGGPVPKQTGQPEIGIVDQLVFEGDRRLSDETARKRSQLEGYGWTDRDAGTVHFPVGRAIEDMLREQLGR
jgi:hypothetical protein